MSIQYHRVDAQSRKSYSHFNLAIVDPKIRYTPPHLPIIIYHHNLPKTYTSQLRLPLLRHLNDKLAKLLPSLHILKQRINPLQVVKPTTDRSRNNRLQILLLHELDHIGEFLARTHRGAAHFDVFEHGGHLEGHGGGSGHAVD